MRTELRGQIGDSLDVLDRDAEATSANGTFATAPRVGTTAPLFTLHAARSPASLWPPCWRTRRGSAPLPSSPR
jgi:hypothetical protein